ncbi:DNA mismatch repair protein MutS [Chloroflexota bacterium]
MTENLTPVRKQYLKIKRDYPDAILFFRLGDFYETFDEDAEITARELDIVLTSRPVGKGVRAPLAGIPYHAVDNYLARLVNKGFHVAICEQVGEQPSKGIFQREVVRVVTPGTIIEPNLLSEGENNYIASVIIEKGNFGISYADITTGEFHATEIEDQDISLLIAELNRINPSEIIHPDNQTLPAEIHGHIRPWLSWKFESGKCQEILKEQLGIISLKSIGAKPDSLLVRCSGSLLQYIKENSRQTLDILRKINLYNFKEFMLLDSATQRNLEITETIQGDKKGSLLELIDVTKTPMGKRLIRQWIKKPLLDVDQIINRQDGIEIFANDSMLRTEFRSIVKKFIDLERIVNRVTSGYIQPRELISLKNTILLIPDIISLSKKYQINDQNCLEIKDLPDCTSVFNLLQKSISDDSPATLQKSGIFKLEYSSDLDNLINSNQYARDWIDNLEKVERDRTGIKNLKVGYNKVFGYFIEISHGNKKVVPAEYIRKQTLVNSERYITPELKEYETILLNADEQIHNLEVVLFKELCRKLDDFSEDLLCTSRIISKLDVISSLAETASMQNYSRPIITKDRSFEIVEGRHPVVEKFDGDKFIPNDVKFEDGEIVRIITGPNMSGKSTYLRQVALILLLAQMGSYVPATSAKIGLVDRIFTRIGAHDEIQSGLSTFMVEMVETANILNNATSRSLIILDELGRGTSTYDGVSIAWSVIEYIHNHPNLRAKTLFATHYHELTQLAEMLPGVRNYNVAVSESDGKVIFLHKIIKGGADRSYGIHVAQLAGLPMTVIQRANDILRKLEKTSGNAIDSKSASAHQVALFPETNPLVEELENLDINSLSPLASLNKLYEWKRKYSQ